VGSRSPPPRRTTVTLACHSDRLGPSARGPGSGDAAMLGRDGGRGPIDLTRQRGVVFGTV